MSAARPVASPATRPAAGAPRPRALTRRHVMLVALLPVLVAVWIPLVGGGKRAAPVVPAVATPADPPPAPGVETAAALPEVALAHSAASLTRHLQELSAPYRSRWTAAAGDPFAAATSATVRMQVPIDDAALPASDTPRSVRLAPSAVLISPGQEPMAIIRGRVCRPGDEVDGHRIVAIEERRVVFRDGGQTFSVSIPAPPLGLEPRHE